jgi:hypothetical protein
MIAVRIQVRMAKIPKSGQSQNTSRKYTSEKYGPPHIPEVGSGA